MASVIWKYYYIFHISWTLLSNISVGLLQNSFQPRIIESLSLKNPVFNVRCTCWKNHPFFTHVEKTTLSWYVSTQIPVEAKLALTKVGIKIKFTQILFIIYIFEKFKSRAFCTYAQLGHPMDISFHFIVPKIKVRCT